MTLSLSDRHKTNQPPIIIFRAIFLTSIISCYSKLTDTPAAKNTPMGKVKAKAKQAGPRGKKARELRKLERRWGEEINEEELQNARIRKGVRRLTEEQSKSRVLAKTQQREAEKSKMIQDNDHYMKRRKITNDSDSDSDSDLNKDIQNHRDPMTTSIQFLLQSIRKTRQDSFSEEISESSEDSNHESCAQMDENRIMENDASTQSSFMSYDEEQEQDPIDSDDSSSVSAVRNKHPFYQHFFPSEAYLSDMEKDTTAPTITTRNLVTKILHPSLQLQVSQHILDGDYSSLTHGFSSDPFQKLSHEIIQQGVFRLKKEWETFNSNVYRHNVEAKTDTGLSSSHCNMSSLQSVLLPFFAKYTDALLTCETKANKESIRNVVILHLLNHILLSNRLISRNNKQLKSLSTLESSEGEDMRDQGFTRPKVLVLLPTRGVCLTFVRRLLQLLGSGSKVDHLDRLETEYSAIPEDRPESEKEKRRRLVLKEKGEDWQNLFGDEVNSDDDFKIGISFQQLQLRGKDKSPRRNVHVKLYSEFYHSDLILASPLALKIHNDSNDQEDHVDCDFLSSIEVCILLDCNTLLMQNWDHVNSVLDQINKQPKRIEGIDFSRVRNLYLSGLASKFRQNIFVSQFIDPNIISSFRKYAQSCSGQVKIRHICSEEMASIGDVSIRIRHVFQRVSSDSFLSQGDDRLKYFTNKILPHILRLEQKHTMIFIPSYFDFTAVRNLLLKKEVNFVSITEYARTSEITRGRARFLQGRKAIMLYTGRSFFFMRHIIKGVKHLVFFGLPEHAEFYPTLVNMMTDDTVGDHSVEECKSCLSLYTKYDAHALERIVGSEYCESMIHGEKSIFLFNS